MSEITFRVGPSGDISTESETFGRGSERRVWGSDSFNCHSKFVSQWLHQCHSWCHHGELSCVLLEAGQVWKGDSGCLDRQLMQ